MSPVALADLGRDPQAFITEVCARVAAGRAIRRKVPGGWLHMDRPLPFLCVHRTPPHQRGCDTERLVLSQAAHLSVAGAGEHEAALRSLITRLGSELSGRFGAFLVLEIWVEAEAEAFCIHAPMIEPATTVAALQKALTGVDVLGRRARADAVHDPSPAPPGLPPLLTPTQQRESGILVIGLGVPGFFLGPDGQPFPGVLRRLQHDLTRALQKTVFEFTSVQTSFRPEDFRAVGPRRLLKATRDVDRRLARIAASLDHLVAITPINAEDAWLRFRDGGYRDEPTFHYRPLRVDPDLLKRSLYAVPLERVEDPTLAGVFRAKRQELDRQMSMLEDRGSPAFLPTSLQLYGTVDAELLSLAELLLGRIQDRQEDTPDAPSPTASPTRSWLDAGAFAARARAEVAYYRARQSSVTAAVDVREDIPGVLVSGGNLLVGADVKIAEERADALIQHEVGTHIVTDVNGGAQPLQLLRVGLPGYEETQEGLAVLAEFVVGGLTAARLATLAARVIAVHRMVAGAGFTETFQHLYSGCGLGAPQSFRITLRVYRSGGLTKDAVYLRGLHRLLGHLGAGHSLEPLLLGKLALDDVPVVQELVWRGVLRPPLLQPRWLTAPQSQDRLRALGAGLSVLDLVPQATS
ncbi:MAG: flavohemoglobin expression-modulating QEGLA motif protein [Sporichthyaceae bacterium]